MAMNNPFQFVSMPNLDPSTAVTSYSLQQKQALIDALKQKALNPTPLQQTAVVPRQSFITPLIQALAGYTAGRQQDKLNSQYADLMNQQYSNLAQAMGGGQSAPQQQDQQQDQGQQQSSIAGPSLNQMFAPQQSSSSNPTQGTPDPIIQQSGNLQPQQQYPQQTSSPLNPSGMNPRIAAMLYSQLGPEKYSEQYMAPFTKPAEINAELRAAGIDPNSQVGKRLALEKLNKSLTNLSDVRPGGTVFDNNTRTPVFTAPNNGSQVNWTPQGPQVSQLPGATAAAGAMAGAETAGKVANTPMTVPTAGGGSTIGYPSQLIGAPPALGGGGAPRSTSGAGATTAISNAKPNDPWSSMPKLQVSSNLGAPDEFTKGRLQAAGAKDAELSTQYGKEADLADQKLQYNAQAVRALPKAETGPLSEWMTENRSKLKELGVPESLIPSSGTITPTLELNKYLKNTALQGARQIYGSRMTQNEVSLQTNEMSPSAHMTRDAIQSLINQDNIRNLYAKQRANDYGKYVQNGGDPLRYETWYSKTFPLTKFAQRQNELQELAKKVTPQQLQEEARRRGLQ